MNIIAENAKALIDKGGFKHKVIAEKAGYSVQAFSRMLNGRKVITPEAILRIATALGVTPNELYGITTDDEKGA